MITIAKLFYMLIKADGHIDPKELEMGRKMAELECFGANDFERAVDGLVNIAKAELYVDCVKGLKAFSEQDQTRFLAWMCLIANSDGFMDNTEWNLIYRIYHKELGLNRQSILDCQFILKKKIQYTAVLN
ncbi:MAG: TerB family tellurite resistance protein [Bacteroidota bacterium]